MGRGGRFSTVYGHYLVNYYRSRSFYLMLILIVLISGLMTYFSFKYTGKLPSLLGGINFSRIPVNEQIRIFSYIWSIIFIYIPVFASVFFGSPAVSSEIENKTAYHIFSLPVGRYTLLTGKYLASFSVTMIIATIYLAVEAAVTGIIFHSAPVVQFYTSYALIALFVLAVTSLTFLVSSIFSKNLYAYISVFVLYFLVFYVTNIVLEFLYSYNAFFLLNNASDIVQKVFVNISIGTFQSTGTISPAGPHEIMISALVMILYAVIAFVASLFIFENREVR